MTNFTEAYPKVKISAGLKNIELELKFLNSNPVHLKGIYNIWDFFESNYNTFTKIKQGSGIFFESREFFSSCRNQIILYINQYKDFQTSDAKNHWVPFKNLIEKSVTQFPGTFPSNSEEFAFLIDLSNNSPTELNSAYNFLTQRNFDLTNSSQFTGLIKALYFKHPELSSIPLRLKYHKKATETVKLELEKYLNEASIDFQTKLIQNKSNYEKYSESFETLLTSAQTSFNTWFDSKQKQFTEFDNSTIQKIKDFEELYTEKLRLEAPTTYWRERADKLNKAGRRYLIWLIALAMLGSGLLFSLLWSTPDGLLTSIFDGDKVKAIRWSIVFIVFLSFFAYGIRILAKITFSSFHLARDAEEREQLTHVYLALKKDAAVDEKDRNLILQSIFSRADTGLLKEDSAPTMPGGILDKAISK